MDLIHELSLATQQSGPLSVVSTHLDLLYVFSALVSNLGKKYRSPCLSTCRSDFHCVAEQKARRLGMRQPFAPLLLVVERSQRDKLD
jgi:hypothetical protein